MKERCYLAYLVDVQQIKRQCHILSVKQKETCTQLRKLEVHTIYGPTD